jgi:hypothetical protein
MQHYRPPIGVAGRLSGGDGPMSPSSSSPGVHMLQGEGMLSCSPLMGVKNRPFPSGYGTKSTDLTPGLAFTDTLLSLEEGTRPAEVGADVHAGRGWEEVRGSIPYVEQVPTLDRASDVAALRTKF